MAHFFRPPDPKPLDFLTAPAGQRLQIGLWNGKGPALTVSFNDPSIAQVAEPPVSRDADTLQLVIVGKKAGRAQLEAKNAQGHIWAFVQVTVTPPPARDRLIEFEIESSGPGEIAGRFVTPRNHEAYIDNRMYAVGFSIYLGGYQVYCSGIELPVLVADADVNFGLTAATSLDDSIYEYRSAADAALAFAPSAAGAPPRYAYYWGAGGRLVAPTIFCPLTAPRTVATMLSARQLLAEEVQRELTILALSLVGGMVIRMVMGRIVRWGQGKPDQKGLPPPRVGRMRPVNGTVNVGGGLEPEARTGMTNLNPLKTETGGPASGIPNHVKASFEEIGEIFETGSVQRVLSRRLPGSAVNWDKAAQGTAKVMGKGGKLDLNVWTNSPQETEQIMNSFRKAGFKNVENTTAKQLGKMHESGPGVVITGTL